MKSFLICSTLAVALLTASTNITLAADASATVWKAEFHDITPVRKGASSSYCRSHSPDAFQTTIAQITGDGVKAKDGVTVKYKNYNETEKNGLYFITVDAVFSGFYGGKPWELETWLHEQKLSPNGKTDVVWSNADCKGKFTGAVSND